MKKNPVLSLILSILFCSVGYSQNAIPTAVQATLESPQFAEVFFDYGAQAKVSGLSIKLSGFYSTAKIGEQLFTYIGVQSRPVSQPESSWQTRGNFVGVFKVGDQGQEELESVYFEPVAPPPSAGRVGNL